ncbi:PREDICTED: cytochrome c oxidase-assembly factor COX23, mitochondrial-like [Priapulus caudatus]|uniref:Coiled-coil-helix-coiled-coil-helix domain-containing protein 7 n=1 Tax=Priapulus caudatus TaxID=37621 RepID=A0ABM1E2X1_PRICU|nr:PREDICTED: cytochrome c oxidase-assembly factor COX23, mitochondrial-like [Priapulus caudatus]
MQDVSAYKAVIENQNKVVIIILITNTMVEENKHTKNNEITRNARRCKEQSGELNNPCYLEQKLTYKCLNNKNFDQEACNNYFVNYNNCKAFWNSVRIDRKRKGIQPNLPLPEDREQIKAEYMSKQGLGYR